MPDNPSEETRRDWEKVQENASDVTERLKVVNGWLYRTVFKPQNNVSMVFVPSKD